MKTEKEIRELIRALTKCVELWKDRRAKDNNFKQEDYQKIINDKEGMIEALEWVLGRKRSTWVDSVLVDP